MKKLLTLFAILALAACTDDGGNNDGGIIKQTAKFFTCHYCGDEYSSDDTANYDITFSDKAIDGQSEFKWLYTLGIYATERSLDKIPNGTYILDKDNTNADRTIATGESERVDSKEGNFDFTSATLEVTDEKIVLNATTEDGKTYLVIYSGDYEIIDISGDNEGDEGDEGDEPTSFDYEREAQIPTVYFYGDEYSADLGTMNYYITLSDSEETWRYDIDLFAEEMSFEKVPAGTYHLDNEDSGAGKTFSYSYSGLYFPQTEEFVSFTEAKFVVTDTELVLTATTEDGKTHKVTFSGDYEIVDDRTSDEGSGSEGSEGDEGYGEWATTLTKDIAVEYNEDYVYAEYWGDDYEMGYNIIVFYFEREDYIGDSLNIEIAVEDTDYVGAYSPCKAWDYAEVGNLISANMNTSGEPYGGCWYYHSEDGAYYDESAPLVAGSLTITDNNDDTYTFVYEGYDAVEGGHKVSLNWTGKVNLSDETQEASAKRRISPMLNKIKVKNIGAHSPKKLAAKLRK